MSGLSRATLIGLRAGALIAAELSKRKPAQVNRLVAWEPPSTGSEVVDWAHHAPTAECSAFPLSASLESGLMAFGAMPIGTAPSEVMVLCSRPIGLAWPVDKAAETVMLPEDGPRCWTEDRDHGAGAVPIPVLARITEWVRS
jgi:pimeloyl-ACP methyl ester carboxylesterase